MRWRDDTTLPSLHCGISVPSMSAMGHFRQIGTLRTLTGCPVRSESGHAHACLEMSAKCQKRTHAPRLRLRALTLQLFDSSALSPFSSSHAVDRFEAHFEKSVLLFAPVSALMRRQGLAPARPAIRPCAAA